MNFTDFLRERGQFFGRGLFRPREIQIMDVLDRDEMDMNVRDFEARHHHPDLFARDGLLDHPRDFFGKDHEPAQKVIVDVKNIIDLLFRDDQRMSGIERPQVEERQIILVFKDLMTGDLALNDPAKNGRH